MYDEKINAYFDAPERRAELVEAISRLVRIRSVREEPLPGMPFGPGPAAALAVGLKLAEELGELQSAVADDTNIKEELGDLLFAAVKVARFFHIDPEEALEGTCEKFIRRFSAVEAAVTAQGQDMKDVDVSQLMVYWNRAKHPAKDEIEETEEEKGQST